MSNFTLIGTPPGQDSPRICAIHIPEDLKTTTMRTPARAELIVTKRLVIT